MQTITEAVRFRNFPACRLKNDKLSVTVLPDLGGKIASLYSRETEFEAAAQWNGSYRLPSFGDAFSAFDSSGIDDAFPNIDSEEYEEFFYPDHGAVWSSQMAAREEAGRLVLETYLTAFGCVYQKEFSLMDSTLRVHYRITSKNPKRELPYIWTLHDLIRYEKGMCLVLPEEIREVLITCGSRQGSTITVEHSAFDIDKALKQSEDGMVKFYSLTPVRSGRCGYLFPSYHTGLMLSYDPEILPYLGLWITAGGYRGDYNCALEPSTGFYDSVSTAEKTNTLRRLSPGGTLEFDMDYCLSRF